MSAAPPAVLNPTIEEIRRLTQPNVRVFNPTDYTKVVDQYGDGYVFPALYELAITNKMRYKEVHDLNPRSPSNAVAWHNPKDHPRDRTADVVIAVEAAVIAAAICEEDRYGKIGFCVLLNDGQDETRKAAARRKWIGYRVSECQALELGMQRKVQSWQTAHPGTYPRMNRSEIEALRWLRRYDSGEFEHFGQENKEQAEAIDLFLGRNPSIANVQGPEAAQTVSAIRTPVAPHEDQDPPIGQATPEQALDDVEEEAGSAGVVLFERARNLGIKLTTLELQGLFEDDPKVVARVARKVARNG